MSENRHVEISAVSKSFDTPNGPQVVVEGFDLRIAKGEFVSLIGHSGCGKSTVLSMVAGLTKPSGGGILLDDREVTEPGPDRGVVFQAPCLLPWLTALENVRLAVQSRAEAGWSLFKVWNARRDLIEKAEGILERVRLADKRQLRFHDMARVGDDIRILARFSHTGTNFNTEE